MRNSLGFDVSPKLPRVEFGVGCIDDIAAATLAAGASSVLVIASGGRVEIANRISEQLGERSAGIETRTEMHVPAELAERVAASASANSVDMTIAIGGGSVIGMAKAVALINGTPIMAVPTTFSGSEMTSIWGMTRDGIKTTGRDERVRPIAVFYDPALVSTLPVRTAIPSGLNALAHCIEALYAPDATEISTMSAVEGTRVLVQALPQLAAGESHLVYWGMALRGAWLGGSALGMVQMGLHHKLCHTLGGTFGLPHAETHAILLPYSIGYNAVAAADKLEPVRENLETTATDLPVALYEFVDSTLAAAGAPRSLAELGFSDDDAAKAAALAVTAAYPNPEPLVEERIRSLLVRATIGPPPIS